MKPFVHKKIIYTVPALCLLLSAFGAVGANAAGTTAKETTDGAVVEVFSGGELKSKTEFDTVSEAWKNAVSVANKTDETVITLGEDWTEDESLTIKYGQHITLDLNGHYIKRNRNHDMVSDGNVFKVQQMAVFTLRDSNPKSAGYDGIKGGVITGGASSNSGGGVHIEEFGKFYMEGGTIYDCITNADGGGVNVYGNTTDTKFIMTGGRIYSCKTVDSANNCYGGGVYMEKGEVNISNAKIDDCYSEDDGGAIYSERGTITLKNVVFTGNKAHEDGGAICTALDSYQNIATTLNAYDCTFANNHADENGGAVKINDNPADGKAVVFHNCKFRNNDAVKKGGAVYINDDNIALSSCEIVKNSAGEEGGGVFVDDRYNITLKGLMTIKDNTSDKGNGVADLALEDGNMGTARIINGGLYKNSYVRVGSTSEKSVLISEWMSQYQMQYFRADEGTLSAKDLREVDATMVVTASIFSEGGIYAIVIIGSAGIIGTVMLIIYKKRKDKVSEGGKEYDDNEES